MNYELGFYIIEFLDFDRHEMVFNLKGRFQCSYFVTTARPKRACFVLFVVHLLHVDNLRQI